MVTKDWPVQELINQLGEDIDFYEENMKQCRNRIKEYKHEIEDLICKLPALDQSIQELVDHIPEYHSIDQEQNEQFRKRRTSIQELLTQVPRMTTEQRGLNLTERFYNMQELYTKKKVVHDMGNLIWDILLFTSIFVCILMTFFHFLSFD
ncbi:hypothetical protein DM01DRAFT_1409199 [Hesseltinella vesiculosa]|uniref:Uncharacterized protein n=1 Tax=Hesseltinella vesiculosa TaxID=101127 RepID=A0A1X2GBY5_9FUNG|nr:hypothetical protein DM01DRAFT_1409199 [Hesseltinella vesiculosa]